MKIEKQLGLSRPALTKIMRAVEERFQGHESLEIIPFTTGEEDFTIKVRYSKMQNIFAENYEVKIFHESVIGSQKLTKVNGHSYYFSYV